MSSFRSRRRLAVQRLGAAGKSDRGAAAYSRWINRPLGRQCAALAYCAGLTANAITVVSAGLSAVGILLLGLLRPTWITASLVVIILLVAYALDSADGQVARLTGTGSPSGEWLDHVFDAAKIPALHLAVAVCWFRFFTWQHAAWLLVPLSFATVSTVFFFALVLTDMLRRIGRAAAGGTAATTALLAPGEKAPALRSFVVLPGDWGLLVILLALLPLHGVFRDFYSALACVNALFLVAGGLRWYRELDHEPLAVRPTHRVHDTASH